MSQTKKVVGRGRPQMYPLTANQEKSIRSRIEKGQTSREIIAAMGVHEFAVLRVRRAMRAEA